MTESKNPMAAIQLAAREYRKCRDVLSERSSDLHDQLEAVKRSRIVGLRNAVSKTKEAEAALMAAIEANPQCFLKPRTVVLEGVKLGYQKAKGKITWEQDDQVIKLIRKHFPDAADILIKCTEKPVRDALSNLTAAELKKLGVNITEAGDEVVIKDTTATVDKLVAALLKGEEETKEA